MKVLQLSNKVPYPEKDGGVIAISALSRGLIEAGCQVKLLALNTKKHFVDINSIPKEFRESIQLETVEINTTINAFKALAALISNKSYNISRFESKEFDRKLTDILQKEKFDIIQLEGLYLGPYIPIIRKHSNAAIILREHNVEWKIWEWLAKEERNILKKWYLRKLTKQLKAYEEGTLNTCDGVATITKNDKALLIESGCKVPIAYIPFGIDISAYAPKENNSNRLFYIGALDWLPNLQGLDWFFKNVWNTIHTVFPAVEFHVAGRNMPESLRNSNYPGVVFHGEVESAKIFMDNYDIMLVPLFAGSGVRVKIIEGMAMGRPIVTTSVGIEGIECTYGQDALVADIPEKFGEAILACLKDENLKNKLGKNARKFAETNNDIKKITSDLIEFYKEVISKN